MVFGQLLEHVDAAAGEQRAVDFERGIFGGRPDQANISFFDVREKRILLRLVEAMNFVDEDDGARAILAGAIGVSHNLLDFLDAREHGGEFDELGFGDAGDDFCERSFAGAGRPPENHRSRVVALDLHPQRLAWPDEVFLAHEFFERARAHAVRQRTSAGSGCAPVIRNGSEQAHPRICNL